MTRFVLCEENRYMLLAFPELFKGLRVVIAPRHIARGKFISLFDKSPPDIVCPSFWELKWATGCVFRCKYCYLQGTLYGNIQPRLKCLNALKDDLIRFLRWAKNAKLRVLLNTGELTDSFAMPGWTERLLRILDEVAEIMDNLKVLFVTKAGSKHIKPLLKHAKTLDYGIISFSINTHTVASRYEDLAPDPSDRIKAAKICQDYGFEVRFRLDPMIPIGDWKKEYAELLVYILSKEEVEPTRITIGTLRGLNKTIRFANDRQWTIFLKQGEKTGWGLKMPREARLLLYETVLGVLKELGFRGQIALCKETLSIWRELASKTLLNDPGSYPLWCKVFCNCLP